MQQCKLTFGWLVRTGRRELDLSQKEFCSLIAKRFSISLDWKELSKIENNRINGQVVELDSFVYCIAEVFELVAKRGVSHRAWVQQIREQTEAKSLDFSLVVFPIYFKQNDNN